MFFADWKLINHYNYNMTQNNLQEKSFRKYTQKNASEIGTFDIQKSSTAEAAEENFYMSQTIVLSFSFTGMNTGVSTLP